MGKKSAIVAQTRDADDAAIRNAFAEAKKWLQSVGQSTSSQPDVAKIRAAMEKAKKPLAYVATLVDLKSFDLEAMVAGKVVDGVVGINLHASGQEAWRAALETLKRDGKLVADADLKAWDTKHPDPRKVAELQTRARGLEKELSVLNLQIKRLQDAARPKAEQFLQLQKELKALGA